MLRRIYSLSSASRIQLHQGQPWLVCDYPRQAHRLNDTAWRILSVLKPEAPLDTLVRGVTPAVVEYLENLAAAGALRAEYFVNPPGAWPHWEVVVPVYANPQGLARCLTALSVQTYPLARVRVTIVDDASPEPVEPQVRGRVPEGLTLRWLRCTRNVGPGAARNLALRTPWPGAAPSERVAFTDSDCVPSPDWLSVLAALLEPGPAHAPPLSAVGTAIPGVRTDSLVARYEYACSSLNRGKTSGRVGPGWNGAPYLPTANLAVNREALTSVGGFREELRFGEDVDLCLRLAAQGHRLFYFAQGGAVAHDHGAGWSGFLRRRWHYAASEAWLRFHHPLGFPPSRLGGVSWGLGVLAGAMLFSDTPGGWALGGAGVALLMWPGKRRGTLDAPSSLLSWSWRVQGLALLRGWTVRLLTGCRVLIRQGLAYWVVLALAFPALWPWVTSVFALGALAEWLARRPVLSPWEFLLGYGMECLAYSLGRGWGQCQLWARAWRGREPESGNGGG